MTLNVRRIGSLGAAILAVALPSFAFAQAQSDLTKSMGIDQKLGDLVPKDVAFTDETGASRTFGSLLKGRPLLVLPISLRCQAGCHLVQDGLEKTLFHADRPNEHKLIQKSGPNHLLVGRDLDIVILSLDPREKPADAAVTKVAFEDAVGYAAEPVTVLTGTLPNIRRITDAIGFRYFFDPAKDILNNATGSVLLTPEGRVSSYTIANDFPTIVLERNVETAQANAVETKADQSQMFGCIQQDPALVARRTVIERYITGAALVTLAALIYWIVSMLRSERTQLRDLGGQPRGA